MLSLFWDAASELEEGQEERVGGKEIEEEGGGYLWEAEFDF